MVEKPNSTFGDKIKKFIR